MRAAAVLLCLVALGGCTSPPNASVSAAERPRGEYIANALEFGNGVDLVELRVNFAPGTASEEPEWILVFAGGFDDPRKRMLSEGDIERRYGRLAEIVDPLSMRLAIDEGRTARLVVVSSVPVGPSIEVVGDIVPTGKISARGQLEATRGSAGQAGAQLPTSVASAGAEIVLVGADILSVPSSWKYDFEWSTTAGKVQRDTARGDVSSAASGVEHIAGRPYVSWCAPPGTGRVKLAEIEAAAVKLQPIHFALAADPWSQVGWPCPEPE